MISVNGAFKSRHIRPCEIFIWCFYIFQFFFSLLCSRTSTSVILTVHHNLSL